MGIDREKIFFPYLSNYDVEEMYIILKGSRKGISSFMKKAKTVATGNIYKDEEALFEIFKVELSNEIKARKIQYFGELVQMIS